MYRNIKWANVNIIITVHVLRYFSVTLNTKRRLTFCFSNDEIFRGRIFQTLNFVDFK